MKDLELEEENKEECCEEKFISLCADTTFKYLIKNLDTRYWFYEIIEDITGYNLNNYNLVDNEDNTGNKRKDYRMDTVLEKDDIMFVVEMNNDYYPGVEEKSKEYVHRKAGRYFYEGEKYKEIYTIGVFFNNYYSMNSSDLRIGEHVIYETNTKTIDDTFKYYQIYLPNYKKVSYNSSRLEKRLSAFSCKNYDELEKILKEEDKIIVETLKSLSGDEEFMTEYEREIVYQKEVNTAREGWKEIGLEEGRKEGLKEGREEGLKEGREEGIKEGTLEQLRKDAKAMLNENISIDIIVRITGLSKSEIESL